MKRKEKKIGEILLGLGLITNRQLELALSRQKESKDFIGNILVEKGFIDEKKLIEALAEQFNLEVTSLANKYFNWDLVKRFSASLVLDHRCFPVTEESEVVTFAICNPLDVWAISRIEEEAGRKYRLVLVTKNDMDGALARYQRYRQAEFLGGFS